MTGSKAYKTFTKAASVRVKNDMSNKSSNTKPTVKSIKCDIVRRWDSLPESSRKNYSN